MSDDSGDDDDGCLFFIIVLLILYIGPCTKTANNEDRIERLEKAVFTQPTQQE